CRNACEAWRARWRAISSGAASALTRRHVSRSPATPSSRATPSSSASASASAAAAEAISFACTPDSSPARSAASTPGSSRRREAVSSVAKAAPTEAPARRASQCAAERSPAPRHRLESATRRAASAFPAPASFSMVAKVSTSSAAASAANASGSSPTTISRNAASTSCRRMTTPASMTIGSRGSERVFDRSCRSTAAQAPLEIFRRALLDGPGTLAEPELAERLLHPQVPDDVADERQQEPEAPEHGDEALATIALVHVLDLVGDGEHHHRRDHDVDDDAEHAAEAVAVVLLEVLGGAVGPECAPDAEGDDGEEDDEAGTVEDAADG